MRSLGDGGWDELQRGNKPGPRDGTERGGGVPEFGLEPFTLPGGRGGAKRFKEAAHEPDVCGEQAPGRTAGGGLPHRRMLAGRLRFGCAELTSPARSQDSRAHIRPGGPMGGHKGWFLAQRKEGSDRGAPAGRQSTPKNTRLSATFPMKRQTVVDLRTTGRVGDATGPCNSLGIRIGGGERGLGGGVIPIQRRRYRTTSLGSGGMDTHQSESPGLPFRNSPVMVWMPAWEHHRTTDGVRKKIEADDG